MAKVFVVIGVNDLLQKIGPVGVARTAAGRAKILREQASICDQIKSFEMEIEEDKSPA